MKEGQKYLCIKEYSINNDCLFTKGEVYKAKKRYGVWRKEPNSGNRDEWLIECNAKQETNIFLTRTTVPMSILQDRFSEYLVTEKQIRKLKLDKLNLIYTEK